MQALLLAALMAVLLAASPAPGNAGRAVAAETAISAETPIKVVYHINDASVARPALRNMENHLDADPSVKIVVVTHGKGIDFLLNDAKDAKGPFEPQVADLRNRGVTFDVCNNTLKGRKLDASAVIMEAQVVPSGVAEIARLQAREGYVYLKP